jgi:hypothetical protein
VDNAALIAVIPRLARDAVERHAHGLAFAIDRPRRLVRLLRRWHQENPAVLCRFGRLATRHEDRRAHHFRVAGKTELEGGALGAVLWRARILLRDGGRGERYENQAGFYETHVPLPPSLDQFPVSSCQFKVKLSVVLTT